MPTDELRAEAREAGKHSGDTDTNYNLAYGQPVNEAPTEGMTPGWITPDLLDAFGEGWTEGVATARSRDDALDHPDDCVPCAADEFVIHTYDQPGG